jgi:hypothetical protein
MDIEGVWKVEILGPYEWEQLSTAFLQKGQYLGASAHHHSVGSYEENDGAFAVRIRLTQHGTPRTVFGETSEVMDLQMQGSVEGDGVIRGKANPVNNEAIDVKIRMTRLDDIA